MNKTLSLATIVALAAAQGVSAQPLNKAREHFAATADNPFRWAPESKGAPRGWHNLAKDVRNSKFKSAVTSPDVTMAPGDNVAYLDMPDGTTWFVVSTLDKQILEQNEYYTDYSITGIHATVYNDNYEPVGKIDKTITCPAGFKRCSGVEFGAVVSQKFFNLDNNYEVMLLMNFNPVEGYGSTAMTQVYSLRGAEQNAVDVALMPGYYIAAVNNAADNWSEDFFMEFFSGEEYTDTEINYQFDIYTKAGYSNPGATLMHTFKENMLYVMSDGQNETMPVMLNSRGRDVYVTCAKYEKTFFEDPFDYANENLSQDNRYVIDLYKKNGSKNELVKVSTTAVPCETVPEGVFTRTYSLGMFRGIDDISFDFGTQTPAYVVSVTDTDLNENTSTHYRVYGADGILLKTFGEGNMGYLQLSSVSGYPEQFVFLMQGGEYDNYKYSFCNWPDMTPTVSIDRHLLYDGGENFLSMSLDRAPGWGGYRYAFSGAYGQTDDQDNTLHDIVWFDAQGQFLRVDRINAGQDITLVNPLVAGYALNPYLFNTDAAQEYIYLALRRENGDETRTHTELCVGNDAGATLMQYVFPRDASQMGVTVLNLATKPAIWINYMSAEDDKHHSEFISLPLNKMLGSGTEADPYRLAVAGDVAQIKNNLKAHYVLANDIDFGGTAFEPVTGTFGGVLDGAGHSLQNFTLADKPMFEQLAPVAEGASVTVKNLRIENVTVDSAPAVLAARASGARISDVHLSGIVAESESDESFGSLVNTATAATMVSGCSATEVVITREEAENIGGLVCTLGSESKVVASLFEGSINAASFVGGAVASMATATASVSNCHVDANITALNNVGGLVGSNNRGVVANNFVEGEISASKPRVITSEVTGQPVAEMNVGGLIGSLMSAYGGYDDNGNPTDASDAVVVEGNVVAVSSITVPEAVDGCNPAATTHRIIGRSRANDEPDTPNAQSLPEAGLKNNFAYNDLLPQVDSLAVATGVEGADLAFNAATKEFFQSIGFKFDGASVDAPWVFNRYPALFFEKSQEVGGSLAFNPGELTVEPGVKAGTTLILGNVSFESLTVEVSDEANCVANPVAFDDNDNVIFEIEAMAPGVYTVTATDGVSQAVLTVYCATSGIADATTLSVVFDGSRVYAPGADIVIYNVSGTKVASGTNSVATSSLAPGIYMAVAIDALGHVTTAKFVVK